MTVAEVAGRAAAAERPGRLWEIDAARTVAIAMMVAYHAVYDLHFLSAETVGADPFSGGWKALRVATGVSFLGVAGLSFWVSTARARAAGLAGWGLWRKHARRGAQVMGWGVVVTLATLAALGTDDYVRFGVLSAIGASILLAPLVARLGAWNAVAGAAIVTAGLLMNDVRSGVPGAFILGFRHPDGAGVDWYPLAPWFGVFAIGIAAGALLYPDGRRGPLAARLPRDNPLPAAARPGRHSLAVYLLHQPVLIALLAAGLAVAGVDLGWR
ncbi:MAG: heparan-alpha-glucosaminide N-acetyltransferase [Actinomycetota bacterium]